MVTFSLWVQSSQNLNICGQSEWHTCSPYPHPLFNLSSDFNTDTATTPVLRNVRFTNHCALYCAEKQVVELVQGGAKLRVRNNTKHQYLDVLAQYRLANSQRDEMEHFLKGLNELIPDNLLSIFDENELEVRLHRLLHRIIVVTCIREVTDNILLGFYSHFFMSISFHLCIHNLHPIIYFPFNYINNTWGRRYAIKSHIFLLCNLLYNQINNLLITLLSKTLSICILEILQHFL